MDSLVGFKGKDFVILAAEASAARGIISYKRDEDKLFQLDSRTVLAGNGEKGDLSVFSEFISKNITLFSIRDEVLKSTSAIAHFIRLEVGVRLSATRTQLAKAVRKNPYQCNFILGGLDRTGPSIFFLDYLGTLQPMNYCCQGQLSIFMGGVLDSNWKANMTEEEAVALVRQCIASVNGRTIVHQPVFKVKIIDAQGIREIAL